MSVCWFFWFIPSFEYISRSGRIDQCCRSIAAVVIYFCGWSWPVVMIKCQFICPDSSICCITYNRHLRDVNDLSFTVFPSQEHQFTRIGSVHQTGTGKWHDFSGINRLVRLVVEFNKLIRHDCCIIPCVKHHCIYRDSVFDMYSEGKCWMNWLIAAFSVIVHIKHCCNSSLRVTFQIFFIFKREFNRRVESAVASAYGDILRISCQIFSWTSKSIPSLWTVLIIHGAHYQLILIASAWHRWRVIQSHIVWFYRFQSYVIITVSVSYRRYDEIPWVFPGSAGVEISILTVRCTIILYLRLCFYRYWNLYLVSKEIVIFAAGIGKRNHLLNEYDYCSCRSCCIHPVFIV